MNQLNISCVTKVLYALLACILLTWFIGVYEKLTRVFKQINFQIKSSSKYFFFSKDFLDMFLQTINLKSLFFFLK